MTNRIKCIRKINGWSQKEFADKLNVDQTAVSNWETGKNGIDVEIAIKIAEIVKVPVEFVFGRDFELKKPLDCWHSTELDELKKAGEGRDYILFKLGAGYFKHTEEDSSMKSDHNTIIGNNSIIGNGNTIGQPLTNQEKTLYDLFQRMDEIQKAELLSYAAAKLKK